MLVKLSGNSENVYRHCMSTIVKLCFDNGSVYINPAIVHADFELAVVNVLKKYSQMSALNVADFILLGGENPESRFKSGIQKFWIWKWLQSIFGIEFLGPDEAEDAFIEDFMSMAPANDKMCTEFADYLKET